jgi:hypothetical protein
MFKFKTEVVEYKLEAGAFVSRRNIILLLFFGENWTVGLIGMLYYELILELGSENFQLVFYIEYNFMECIMLSN